MAPIKWTLALFILAILVQIISGIKCWTCEDIPKEKKKTCNGGRGELREYGEDYFCMWSWMNVEAPILVRWGMSAKKDKEYLEILKMGCHPHLAGTRCFCDTDACNDGPVSSNGPRTSILTGFGVFLVIALAYFH